MDRNKALDRIRKCLELSRSHEPHEAAAAIRQAQKLMEAHNITEKELGLITYSKVEVQVPIQYTKTGAPLHLTYLMQVVMQGLGVRALLGAEKRVSDYSFVTTYYGVDSRCQMAKYVHELLFRTAHRAWNEVRVPTRGARTSFLVGWYMAVSKQVPSMALSDEDIEKLKQMRDELAPGSESVKDNKLKLDSRHVRQGIQAAADFRLHRPLE